MAVDVEHHEIFLSGLRVRVRSSCARTNRYIRKHWCAASIPLVEPWSSCEIEVVAGASPRIVVDREVVWIDGVAEDLLAGFEQWLYRLAIAKHKGRFSVFHAAAVVRDGATVVLAGASGAGKSSLALAAVRRGWKYFTDEFVVTDGERVWGWPRAIRFDPPTPGIPLPEHLRDLETDVDGRMSPTDAAPPYYPVATAMLPDGASSAESVHLLRVAHGSRSTLSKVSTSAGLISKPRLMWRARPFPTPITR